MLSLQQLNVTSRLAKHVESVMLPDPTGHDWPHVQRVLKNAGTIAATEGGDFYLVTLIALTHDLYDHKFFDGTEEKAREKLAELLKGFGVDEQHITSTVDNVFSLSFSKSNHKRPLSNEGKIVQDADRLEAIGAIGIARAFAYGGYKKRLMHATENKPQEGTTFDHFFEKLLKLYDLLNTTTAKQLAKDRFEFMQEFVKRFGEEWGEDFE